MVAPLELCRDGQPVGPFEVGRGGPGLLRAGERFVEPPGHQAQLAEPEGGVDERPPHLLQVAGELDEALEIGQRVAAPEGLGPLEVPGGLRRVAGQLALLRGDDVAAELPEVDLDLGRRGQRQRRPVDP